MMSDGKPISGVTPPAKAQKGNDGAPTKEAPVAIEEVDRLKMENIELRLRNLSLQHDQLQHDIGMCRAQMTKAVQEQEILREQMQAKYKVDFSKFQVRAGDGVLVPKPQR